MARHSRLWTLPRCAGTARPPRTGLPGSSASWPRRGFGGARTGARTNHVLPDNARDSLPGPQVRRCPRPWAVRHASSLLLPALPAAVGRPKHDRPPPHVPSRRQTRGRQTIRQAVPGSRTGGHVPCPVLPDTLVHAPECRAEQTGPQRHRARARPAPGRPDGCGSACVRCRGGPCRPGATMPGQDPPPLPQHLECMPPSAGVARQPRSPAMRAAPPAIAARSSPSRALPAVPAPGPSGFCSAPDPQPPVRGPAGVFFRVPSRHQGCGGRIAGHAARLIRRGNRERAEATA